MRHPTICGNLPHRGVEGTKIFVEAQAGSKLEADLLALVRCERSGAGACDPDTT
jgi:hypothetical protein